MLRPHFKFFFADEFIQLLEAVIVIGFFFLLTYLQHERDMARKDDLILRLSAQLSDSEEETKRILTAIKIQPLKKFSTIHEGQSVVRQPTYKMTKSLRENVDLVAFSCNNPKINRLVAQIEVVSANVEDLDIEMALESIILLIVTDHYF